ncbi:MAG: phytoene desaturase [Gammaproteobacteria bacterium]
MNKKNAVIIGSGFGGLAATCRLAAMGYHCTLLERNPDFGGRARVFKQDGFTFDAGPTVITARYLIDELFNLLGEQSSDHLQFVQLDPWYTYIFEDGAKFVYGGTQEKTLENIAALSPEDVDNYSKFIDFSKSVFERGYQQLASHPFTRFTEMLAQAPYLLKLRSDRSVYECVKHYFKNEYLVNAFSIPPLLVGGNPLTTTSIYLLIHYLENKWGVEYSVGGTGAIVTALIKVLQFKGIQCLPNHDVVKIYRGHNGHGNYKVECANGSIFDADVVVCNSDPHWLFSKVLEDIHPSRFRQLLGKRYHYSMGLFVGYFGTDKMYPSVSHHTIYLQKDMRSSLQKIFSNQPTEPPFNLYLHHPTATDPSVAPPGHETFYVLVPVGNTQSGINWQQYGAQFWETVKQQLENTLLPDLTKHIKTEKFVTPYYFEQDLASYHGSGFGIQPLFTQSAWFRFLNQPIKNEQIYLVGANTHPGAGVPGVINSAKIVEKLMQQRR